MKRPVRLFPLAAITCFLHASHVSAASADLHQHIFPSKLDTEYEILSGHADGFFEDRLLLEGDEAEREKIDRVVRRMRGGNCDQDPSMPGGPFGTIAVRRKSADGQSVNFSPFFFFFPHFLYCCTFLCIFFLKALIHELNPTYYLTDQDLEQMSLEVAGWRVVRDAWRPEGADTSPFRDPAEFGSTFRSTSGIVAQCRQELWTQLRESISAEAPHCWRQPGYYGECERFDSKDACEGKVAGSPSSDEGVGGRERGAGKGGEEAAVPGGCIWHDEVSHFVSLSVRPSVHQSVSQLLTYCTRL